MYSSKSDRKYILISKEMLMFLLENKDRIRFTNKVIRLGKWKLVKICR